MSYHKTLERQLRKIFGKGNDIPANIIPLLEVISNTYEQYDDEKDLLNNTMDVGLLELTESNAALLNQKTALEKAYQELAETQTKLNEAEQIAALMREVEEKNAQLITSEEELKQNLEELQTAQEFLQQKQNALNDALAKNQAIMNALDNSAIVSITDMRGKIIKVNEAFCKVSGYKENELIGADHRIVNSGHHSKQFWVQMWQTISKGEAWRSEVCNRAKDGSLYWIDAVINPIYNEKGKIDQYLSIRYLITQRKEAEQTVIAQNTALQSNLEEVTMLKEASEHSHEELQKLLKNVTDSINYAKRIQKAIIPRETELKKHLDCFVFFRPKDIVSGDFYWFADKGDKKIVAVADCTGHGVSGAFMTMIANNILNQIVHNHEFHAPDEILNIMPILLEKTLLHSEGKIRDGMDIGIVSIYLEDEKTSKVEYAGAKTPLYYVKNRNFEEIKPDRVAIGGAIKDDFAYQKHELLFETNLRDLENPQDLTLYLFSDGYQDQFGGDRNRKFMSVNFKNLLSMMGNRPMEDQKQILIEAFETWKGENRQTDDVLVVGIKL